MNRHDGGIDQEERARRIREEIQRKIAERRGQAPAQAAPPPPLPRPDPFRPVFQEEARPAPPPLRPAGQQPPPPLRPVAQASVREVFASDDDSAAMERQRRLAEQLAQLEEQRREARRLASQARGDTTTVVAEISGGSTVGSRSVAAELRDPRALRRAFVLREVLSAPVALR